MPKPRPTIYDVAKRAGVSKSLVSLVLRGGEGVSEKRREAVQAAIDELGYRPSAAAAALATSRTRTIGLAIDDFQNLWFVDLLRGMREVLDEAGFHVTVADEHTGRYPGHDAIDAFATMRIEALVLAMDPDGDIAQRLDAPIVIAGARQNPPPGADIVSNDDALGAALATQHLIELGHRRIAHLSGLGGAAATRRHAYVTQMKLAGLEPIVVGERLPTAEDAAYATTRELIAARPEITALFAANDLMALGAMGALGHAGLSVPDDVSIVGYDDSPLAQSAHLALTTVDDRSLDVGRETARVLIDRLENRTAPRHEVLLEPYLHVRSTTAVAPPA